MQAGREWRGGTGPSKADGDRDRPGVARVGGEAAGCRGASGCTVRELGDWRKSSLPDRNRIRGPRARRGRARELIDAIDGGALPRPNWMVERRARCGLHPDWCLARPALRGALAAPRPLRAFARIAEYSAEVGSADPGYRVMHAHRLFARAGGPRLQTTLGRRELDELAGGDPARQAQEPESESRAAAAQPGRRSAVHRLAPMMSAISRWGRSGSVLS